MAYSTQADILEQMDSDILVQLTDDADAGAVDADAVTRAIADADAEINGYCGARYATPFVTVPAIIRKVSVDLAIYNLYARRTSVPEDRQKRYTDAIRFLKDVAKGIATLGANDPDGSPAEANTLDIDQSPRLFTRDTLQGF